MIKLTNILEASGPLHEGDIQLWTAPAKSYRYGMEYYKLKSKDIIKKLPSKKTKKETSVVLTNWTFVAQSC